MKNVWIVENLDDIRNLQSETYRINGLPFCEAVTVDLWAQKIHFGHPEIESTLSLRDFLLALATSANINIEIVRDSL